MSSKYKNITGQIFGRLTVLFLLEKRDNSGHTVWLCKCNCGKEKIARGYSLRRGDVRSCGCLKEHCNVGCNKKYASNEEAAWGYNYDQYKRNAKFRKLIFKLSFDDFKKIANMNCHYCNSLPEKRPSQHGRSSIFASGIDRVDNNEGYILSNCVPCCTWCNQAKKEHNVDFFIKKCVAISKNWRNYNYEKPY